MLLITEQGRRRVDSRGAFKLLAAFSEGRDFRAGSYFGLVAARPNLFGQPILGPPGDLRQWLWGAAVPVAKT